jgi:hypothetical protein
MDICICDNEGMLGDNGCLRNSIKGMLGEKFDERPGILQNATSISRQKKIPEHQTFQPNISSSPRVVSELCFFTTCCLKQSQTQLSIIFSRVFLITPDLPNKYSAA